MNLKWMDFSYVLIIYNILLWLLVVYLLQEDIDSLFSKFFFLLIAELIFLALKEITFQPDTTF